MTLKVTGMQNLEKALVELGSRAGKKALLGALRDAAKPVRKRARALAPVKTGKLKKAIKTKAVAGKGQEKGIAKVNIGVFGSKKKHDAYYALMLEGGTKRHSIPSATTGRGRRKTANTAKVSFGGKVYSTVNHPGIKARPFIKPAFEQTYKESLKILSKRLKERIVLETIKKYARNIN